jgi:hypothetical protein
MHGRNDDGLKSLTICGRDWFSTLHLGGAGCKQKSYADAREACQSAIHHDGRVWWARENDGLVEAGAASAGGREAFGDL